MSRQGMMDDSGYFGFEECSRYEECNLEAYKQGVIDGIEESTDGVIEKIEEILEWYKEKNKQFSDVQICIVLDDFEGLIKELKEQLKEQKND